MMTDIREKIKAKIERDAYSWVKKEDGSLGHCPECYSEGAAIWAVRDAESK